MKSYCLYNCKLGRKEHGMYIFSSRVETCKQSIHILQFSLAEQVMRTTSCDWAFVFHTLYGIVYFRDNWWFWILWDPMDIISELNFMWTFHGVRVLVIIRIKWCSEDEQCSCNMLQMKAYYILDMTYPRTETIRNQWYRFW